MTTRRKLAQKILNTVIHFASPGSLDWAQAMRRELDFIENDWTALGWSIGSGKMLLRRPDIRLATAADLPVVAHSFTSKLLRNHFADCAMTLACAIAALGFAFVLKQPLQRTGAAISAVAFFYTAYQHFAQRVSRLPDEADTSMCASSYRANLTHQRDLHSGWPLWSRLGILLCGVTLTVASRVLSLKNDIPRAALLTAIFMLVSIVAVRSIRGKAQEYQRRLDELDALPPG